MTAAATTQFSLDAAFSYTLVEGEDSIVEFLDAVSDHLDELGAADVLIVADEDAQTFTISQLVASHDGESIETVVGKGMGLLRTAFHACQGTTSGWPTSREALVSVRVTQTALIGAGANPKNYAFSA